MTAKVILLNGVGSAGKSTLARAILAQVQDVFLHVPMDYWLEMMPHRTLGTPDGLTFETAEQDGKPVITVVSGPAQTRALRGMRHAVAAMAAQGCNMVVDEVLFGDEAWNAYHALLKPYAFHTVGVFAPLDVLEARERARGDRAIGLARGQFDVVHRGRRYDFTVDTAASTADDCARAIVRRFGL